MGHKKLTIELQDKVESIPSKLDEYNLSISNDKYSLLELNPKTGRKHQLRKQLYMRGFPIIGDQKYKLNKNKVIKDQFMLLHSYKIKFMKNDEKFSYEAKLDSNFKKKIDLYFR